MSRKDAHYREMLHGVPQIHDPDGLLSTVDRDGYEPPEEIAWQVEAAREVLRLGQLDRLARQQPKQSDCGQPRRMRHFQTYKKGVGAA